MVAAGLDNFSDVVCRRVEMFIFHFLLQCHMCQTDPKGQWLYTLPH